MELVQNTPESDRNNEIFQVLFRVMDPEIPAVSVVDLGIVREVTGDGEEVVITPTYSGCPATRAIEKSIRTALDQAGFEDTRLVTVLSPAWTTDWITPRGREQLRAFGIAPPVGSAGKRALFEDAPKVNCPRCGSASTEQISEFGSTACKALWRCNACNDPFDYFKCI